MDKAKKQQLGIYEKYIVRRSDREDRPGYKHSRCEHFVLDMTHDPFAAPALRAYADACEKDGYGPLAEELRGKAMALENAQRIPTEALPRPTGPPNRRVREGEQPTPTPAMTPRRRSDETLPEENLKMDESQKLDTWGVVEVMGHKTFAGKLSEFTVGGAESPEFCKLVGPGSVYCITPTDEATARKAATALNGYSDILPVYIPAEPKQITGPEESDFVVDEEAFMRT